MVSKTLASLDAWLALAEEVLAEQRQFSASRDEAAAPEVHQPPQYSTNEQSVEMRRISSRLRARLSSNASVQTR